MRYLHLFLILNVIVCYAGICGDTVLAAISSSEAVQSCHGQVDEMDAGDDYALGIENSDNEGSKESSCCLDYLGGSSIDIETNVFSVIEVLPVLDLQAKTLENHKFELNHLHKGHDPPDLQVVHSTFLL